MADERVHRQITCLTPRNVWLSLIRRPWHIIVGSTAKYYRVVHMKLFTVYSFQTFMKKRPRLTIMWAKTRVNTIPHADNDPVRLEYCYLYLLSGKTSQPSRFFPELYYRHVPNVEGMRMDSGSPMLMSCETELMDTVLLILQNHSRPYMIELHPILRYKQRIILDEQIISSDIHCESALEKGSRQHLIQKQSIMHKFSLPIS